MYTGFDAPTQLHIVLHIALEQMHCTLHCALHCILHYKSMGQTNKKLSEKVRRYAPTKGETKAAAAATAAAAAIIIERINGLSENLKKWLPADLYIIAHCHCRSSCRS